MLNERMLELQNISKKFGSRLAVRQINLAISTGETRALVGPSGSGKTTLMRLIAGLIQADEGAILINGTPLHDLNLRETRLKMGYVIQNGGLFPHLTAKENAVIVAKTLRWTKERIESRLQETISLTEFPQALLGQYPSELSGGERQRLSLARALMLDPKILLFDEPLGSLDPLTRQNIQSELKELFAKLQKTVLIVTHDLAEAAYLADLISVVMEGELLQTGTISELFKKPSHPFVSAFINVETKTVLRAAMEQAV